MLNVIDWEVVTDDGGLAGTPKAQSQWVVRSRKLRGARTHVSPDLTNLAGAGYAPLASRQCPFRALRESLQWYRCRGAKGVGVRGV